MRYPAAVTPPADLSVAVLPDLAKAGCSDDKSCIGDTPKCDWKASKQKRLSNCCNQWSMP